MNTAKLIWATPDADEHLAYIARVSNPENQDNPSIEGLLRYMMREGHVSPFDMVNVCIELNTTRDIGRQAPLVVLLDKPKQILLALFPL